MTSKICPIGVQHTYSGRSAIHVSAHHDDCEKKGRSDYGQKDYSKESR